MMKTSSAASQTHLLLPAGAVARLAVECSHAAQLLQVGGLLSTMHSGTNMRPTVPPAPRLRLIARD